MGRRHDAITLPDVLSAELKDRSHWLRGASAIIILIMGSVYVAAQFLATGKAFETFMGWPYWIGVLLGGFVTIAYTSIGGFRAVAYTDMIQALFMLFAVLAVPIVGLVALGGMSELIGLLSTTDPALLDPMRASPTRLISIIAIASALAVGLPFLGVPQLLVRYIAIRDEREIGKASCISVIVIFLFGTGAVATGLVAKALFPTLDDPETVMPLLSQSLFPPLLVGVLTVAVLSAVMSTVSSLLNLTSSTVVRDLYQQCFRPDLRDDALGRIGVWVTLIVGLAGCLIALIQEGMIFNLVLFAWAGLGAAFGPVVLCMLWWPKTTRQGALAGIVAGFATTVVWMIEFKEKYYDLYEMIPGFLAGLIVTIIVSQSNKRKDNCAVGETDLKDSDLY